MAEYYLSTNMQREIRDATFAQRRIEPGRMPMFNRLDRKVAEAFRRVERLERWNRYEKNDYTGYDHTRLTILRPRRFRHHMNTARRLILKMERMWK